MALPARRSLRCKRVLPRTGALLNGGGEEVAGARLVGDVEDGDVGQAGAAAPAKDQERRSEDHRGAALARGRRNPAQVDASPVALGHVQQVHVGEDGGGVHRAAAEAEAEAALGHGGEDVA